MVAAVYIIPEMESSSWRSDGNENALHAGSGTINIDYILIYRCKDMAPLNDSPWGGTVTLFIDLKYYSQLNLQNKFRKFSVYY